MRKLSLALAAALALLVVTTAVGATSAKSDEARLAYDAIPIGNGYYLGGFSDLYPVSDSGNVLYSLTDRGPNSDIVCTPGITDKQFAVPSFTPEILKLVAGGSNLNVVQRIELTENGVPISGRSARSDGKNETPYGPGGCAAGPLAFDPNGVDGEGIVEDPRDGTFWLADEYMPGVLHVSKQGEILRRVLPGGLVGYAPGSPVAAAFPAIVGSHFRVNRGFEGIAISPDGRWLYTLLQSAMQNPPGSSTNFSRAVRVFKLDISDPGSPSVAEEWVYRLDGTWNVAATRDRRISALIWAGTDKLIVEERDDLTPATSFTKLFLTNFTNATNILGGVWDSPATSPTLEENFKLGSATTDANSCDAIAGVTPGCKTTWFDVAAALTAGGYTNGKLEGVAVMQAGHKNAFDPDKDSTVAVVNDNDFNIDGTTNDSKLETFEK